MVLVAGATGNLGGAITRILLTQGKQVRILARAQSNYAPLADAGAQFMLGDLKVRASLDPACRGVDVLITTANSALRGGPDNPQTVDLEGNRNLIDAAKAGGVRQFIFVSALGADSGSPVPFVAAKSNTEEYLVGSGMPYTILAPNAFMDFWIAAYVGLPASQGKAVTIVGDGRRKHSFIAAADVAQFASASVDNRDAMNCKLLLGGPQAITLLDALAAYEQALGKTIPVRHVRPGEPVPGLPEVAWGLAASLDAYDSPIDMADTARKFGIRLTSAQEFVRHSVEGAKS